MHIEIVLGIILRLTVKMKSGTCWPSLVKFHKIHSVNEKYCINWTKSLWEYLSKISWSVYKKSFQSSFYHKEICQMIPQTFIVQGRFKLKLSYNFYSLLLTSDAKEIYNDHTPYFSNPFIFTTAGIVLVWNIKGLQPQFTMV